MTAQPTTPRGERWDALGEALPQVARRLTRASLGHYPTPVEPLMQGVWVKREDRSAPEYGGNKVRPLEVVLGDCQARGVTRIWATGAYGSNHTLATAVHAPRVGLTCGAILFPQPPTETARANARALVSVGCEVRALAHIAAFPFAMAGASRSAQRGGGREHVMPPGAAVPLGALGHLSAGLELALQVAEGQLPAPAHVVLPVGSTCTSAGLCVAFAAAEQLGLWARRPMLHPIRVTPWPVTAPFRIGGLAQRTAALLAELGGPALPTGRAFFEAGLDVTGRYLGRGYGHPTIAGARAMAHFAAVGGPPLDTTYSAKAAAALLDLRATARGPIVFWSTKSSAALPRTAPDALAAAPERLRRWLGAV